jgi:hypothetical protein
VYDYSGGFGYYGQDPDEYADEYEEQEEPQPQPRKRGGQGLRAYAQSVDKENQTLKAKLREQEEAIRDLMANGPQAAGVAPQGTGPQQNIMQNGHSPRLTQEEMLQAQRMQEMGRLGVSPSAGTQAEQIARIRNASSPEELTEYLRSQGATQMGQSYEGMGY